MCVTVNACMRALVNACGTLGLGLRMRTIARVCTCLQGLFVLIILNSVNTTLRDCDATAACPLWLQNCLYKCVISVPMNPSTMDTRT